MGKRVDFSSRSVITPDARIGIQELGVPMKIAMNITFPEKVNARNIEYLRMLVMKNGANIEKFDNKQKQEADIEKFNQ